MRALKSRIRGGQRDLATRVHVCLGTPVHSLACAHHIHSATPAVYAAPAAERGVAAPVRRLVSKSDVESPEGSAVPSGVRRAGRRAGVGRELGSAAIRRRFSSECVFPSTDAPPGRKSTRICSTNGDQRCKQAEEREIQRRTAPAHFPHVVETVADCVAGRVWEAPKRREESSALSRDSNERRE